MNDISAANLFLMCSLTMLVLVLIFKFKDTLSWYNKLGTYEIIKIDNFWYVRKHTLLGKLYNSRGIITNWWFEVKYIKAFCSFTSLEDANKRLELLLSIKDDRF